MECKLPSFRLDTDSVRVRVSLDEARTLLAQESLSAIFSLPGQTVVLRILLDSEGDELIMTPSHECKNLELRVPAQILGSLVAGILAEPRKKIDPSISARFQQEGISSCMKFEIDIFTLKQKSPRL